tara:strand:+ start:435 stop:575 length:141 start_codon:yes stop_codon:yes gene_type:complete
MKKIFLIIISLVFITSCGMKKPQLGNPFGKCPPKDERNVTDILCRE